MNIEELKKKIEENEKELDEAIKEMDSVYKELSNILMGRLHELRDNDFHHEPVLEEDCGIMDKLSERLSKEESETIHKLSERHNFLLARCHELNEERVALSKLRREALLNRVEELF